MRISSKTNQNDQTRISNQYFKFFPRMSECIKRIQRHPNASEHIQMHPNRSGPKTLKNLRKLQKLREKLANNFANKLVLSGLVPKTLLKVVFAIFCFFFAATGGVAEIRRGGPDALQKLFSRGRPLVLRNFSALRACHRPRFAKFSQSFRENFRKRWRENFFEKQISSTRSN